MRAFTGTLTIAVQWALLVWGMTSVDCEQVVHMLAAEIINLIGVNLVLLALVLPDRP